MKQEGVSGRSKKLKPAMLDATGKAWSVPRRIHLGESSLKSKTFQRLETLI
jgi:hypothetical protein